MLDDAYLQDKRETEQPAGGSTRQRGDGSVVTVAVVSEEPMAVGTAVGTVAATVAAVRDQRRRGRWRRR
jgi:hypothetical protein